MNLLERYLNNDPELSFPEIVIQSLGGKIDIINLDGELYYSIRDWVYEVKCSVSKRRITPWDDLKSAILRQGDFDLGGIIKLFKVETQGGLFPIEFTTAEGLFMITQRMADRSPIVRALKKYSSQQISLETFLNDVTKFQASYRFINSEVEEFHPIVINFLDQRGWQTQHHVILPSGKIIDILAIIPQQEILIIECKRTLSERTLFQAIGQVLCYCSEYGQGALPAIACQIGEVGTYAYQSCEKLNIKILEV